MKKDLSTQKARKRRQKAQEGSRGQSRGLLRVYLLKKSSVTAQKCCFLHYSLYVAIVATFAVKMCPKVSIAEPTVPLRGNLVQHSWSPCPRRSCQQILPHGVIFWYRLQSTTIRCVFVQTIQPSHLNTRIRNRPLETPRATPLLLSFQCIKEPPQ